jgi:hypothetical protein
MRNVTVLLLVRGGQGQDRTIDLPIFGKPCFVLLKQLPFTQVTDAVFGNHWQGSLNK